MNNSQRTVLIVDRSQETYLAVRQALSQAQSVDYQLVEAITDAQALAYLQTAQPHCLLLATQAADLNESPLLQQITQQTAPHTYAIILLVDDATPLMTLPTGAHDFLLKTELTALPLQRAINHALDKAALARQLAEQRAFNQMLLESNPDCVKLLDDAGCLLSMNTPGLCLMEIDDFTPLAGQPWTALWPVGSSKLIHAALMEARAGRQGRFQAFCPTAKGTPKWWDVIVTANPLANNEADGAVRFIAASRDITESYQWAETLRANEERQRLGMAVAGLIIAEIDYTTDLVHLGPEAATLFGLPTDVGTVSRTTFYALFHPADRDELLRRIDIAHDPTGPGWFAMEQRIVRPTGETRWLRVRKQVFFTQSVIGTRFLHHALLAAIDITEQKEAEEALRRSEERYRDLFERMDEGFCVLELIYDAADRPVDYRFLEVNPAFVRFTGLIDAVGKTARQLVPNLEQQWVDIYGNIACSGEARRFVEGSAAMGRWFDVYAFRVGGPNSLRVAVLFNNITERKQVEEALRASEEQLRQITDNVPGLISVVNARGEYEMVNQNYQRWLGLEPQEVIGQALPAVLGGGDAYAVAQPNLQRALAGETVTFENRLTTAQGAPLEIMTTYMPRRDRDGRVTGCYILAIDITERKRMEESLRRSEETARQRLAELEAIYDSAPIGLCVLDRELRWVRINERLAEINGFSIQAHLGHSVRELLPTLAPTAEPILRMILIDDEPVLNLELQGETPAQPGVERTWVEHMFPLHDSDGAVIGINIVTEEITERKRQERELQELNATLERRVAERTQQLEEKNQELERSNRELDKFAYVASHDLKSPLRAIDNLAQWIKEDAGAFLPEPSQEHLAKLQGRVRRMEKLLDDLLIYSRVGRLQYSPEMVDLNALLQNLIALLQPSPAFTITVAEPLPTLRTQRVPLEVVLRNLLDNAIKHHDRADGLVHIAAFDQGDWIEFLIRDDGPGIDPQFHNRIFEVFQTLQPRDKVEGSGIGLAIVKKSIESQGGTITVESTPGAGATFRFTWRKG